MTITVVEAPILALYVAAAEEQGVAPEHVAGTIQNDTKEFMVRNTGLSAEADGIISDIFATPSAKMPKFTISIPAITSEKPATADLGLVYTLGRRRRSSGRA